MFKKKQVKDDLYPWSNGNCTYLLFRFDTARQSSLSFMAVESPCLTWRSPSLTREDYGGGGGREQANNPPSAFSPQTQSSY